ncbi:MAG: hypothetical protein MUF51_00130 [Vicinamibacteria bacterium]|jgi:hypothetical protein|nr:hypothetical protein [Vicinamibacteria bacterium]
MQTVRLSTGMKIALDGDLLAVIEALYREVTLKRALKVSFADMQREIQSLVDQMTPANRKRYLVESLFLNSVTYENEMLAAYTRKLVAPVRKSRRRATSGGSK